MNKLAQVLFASGLAGLGVLSVIFDDFAMNWQPVPDGVPFRAVLAYASGAILLVGGVGALIPRTAPKSALVLTLFALGWLLLLQVPRVAANPLDEGKWLGFGENLLLVTGGWIICLQVARQRNRALVSFPDGDTGLRTARLLFGASLPLIGLSHFVYADVTASMVPAWLPVHVGFAYLTGAGHIAAGLGLLLGVVPRLAATLEAAMISLFVLLLHVPGVAAAPASRLQWTMLCVASAYAGAAWAVASSFQGTPWTHTRRAPPTRVGT